MFGDSRQLSSFNPQLSLSFSCLVLGFAKSAYALVSTKHHQAIDKPTVVAVFVTEFCAGFCIKSVPKLFKDDNEIFV